MSAKSGKQRKKRSLGWYFGMVFGDPMVLADVNAPGLPAGGPRWMYAAMWLLIGLLVTAIPGVFLIAWLTSGSGQEPPAGQASRSAGAVTVFDGTYVLVGSRLSERRGVSFIHPCAPDLGFHPGRLTISRGSARLSWDGWPPVEVQVGADGLMKVPHADTLMSLLIERNGTAQGEYYERYCTYHIIWKKR